MKSKKESKEDPVLHRRLVQLQLCRSSPDPGPAAKKPKHRPFRGGRRKQAADIPHYHTDDEAYLSSYRGYQGPADGANGVPLSTITARNRESLNSTTFIQERPSSYGILSCISAFLCCCPVGMAALCYSCRARCAKFDGEFDDARILGRQARDIAIASVILGVFLLLVAALVVILLWQTVGFN